MSNTQNDITRICNDVRDLLLEKNRKYGDSALEPVRVMSQSTPVEQILVRIDDKLSRISRGTGLVGDDEDVITDLIGYFVLLKIALGRQTETESPQREGFIPELYDEILLADPRDVDYTPEPQHSEYYYDRDRNRPYSEWNPESKECGWDPNGGPTC